MFLFGGAAGFFQGDVQKLVDDIGVLRPTIFPSVPRLFNRIFDKVMQGVAAKGAVAQWLFHSVFDSKKHQIKNTGQKPSHMLDNLVFTAVKERLGGRVRAMITGSAPISEEVFNFLQICFCCPVLNGYGLTETSAAVSIMRCSDFEYSAGPPVPCCEVKLMEVPDMGYFAKDNAGEVCVRGPGVQRLLQAARQDQGGARRRWLVPHWRHRSVHSARHAGYLRSIEEPVQVVDWRVRGG